MARAGRSTTWAWRWSRPTRLARRSGASRTRGCPPLPRTKCRAATRCRTRCGSTPPTVSRGRSIRCSPTSRCPPVSSAQPTRRTTLRVAIPHPFRRRGAADAAACSSGALDSTIPELNTDRRGRPVAAGARSAARGARRSGAVGDRRRSRVVRPHVARAPSALRPGVELARLPPRRARTGRADHTVSVERRPAPPIRVSRHVGAARGTDTARRGGVGAVHLHAELGAFAAGRRAGVDLGAARPQCLDDIGEPPELVVTVCDRAHEELAPGTAWLHWSLPDPVEVGTDSAFDATVRALRERIARLAENAA